MVDSVRARRATGWELDGPAERRSPSPLPFATLRSIERDRSGARVSQSAPRRHADGFADARNERVDAIKTIRGEWAGAKIIVLTTYSGDVQAVRALRAGASDYLLKTSLRKELLDAIRAIHAGRRHLPAAVAQEIAIHAADETLSGRETEILQLVAAGNANKAIAWRLSISEATVKAHMKSIFAKLDVGDRTHAVTVAVRRGIIDL